jgi:protease-4
MLEIVSKVIKWIGQHFLGMLFLLIAVMMFMPRSTQDKGPENLQEIKLSGNIIDADKVLKEIEGAKTNSRIKGVLFTVNSPGGAVTPSIEIAYAIKELKEVKPVIAYAGGIMASGSYYSSIHASKIIANPGAMIGSIGVILQSPNVEELMGRVGISAQTVKQGAYKETGTFTRKWTKEERKELEEVTGDAYELFVRDVAEARGLRVEDKAIYADAHIFMAHKAKEVGLIDEVATKSIAKKELAKLAGVKNPVWKEKSKIDIIIEEMDAKLSTYLPFVSYGVQAKF